MSTETEFNLQQEITAIRAEVKSLAKLCRKIKAKQDDPDGSKAKARASNNGFNRQQKVDDELRTFLGLAPEQLISRSEVTKKINEYIKSNNLQVPEFKQTFTLDDTLAKIFNLNTGTVVNYFKMQSYLKHHYPKAVS